MQGDIFKLCSIIIFLATPGYSFDLQDVAKGVGIINELTRQQQTQPSQTQPQNQQRQQIRYDKRTIAEIQSTLADLGYAPGPIDGLIGRKTAQSIREFEADHRLPVTGQPSQAILQRMQAEKRARRGTTIANDPRPSFDCASAATPTEKAICRSENLAAYDRDIAKTFAQAREHLGPNSAEELLRSQRAWLKTRNSCGADPGCLEATMRERLHVLTGTVPGSSDTSLVAGDTGTRRFSTPNVRESADGGWRAGDRIIISAQGRYDDPIDDKLQRDAIGSLLLLLNMPDTIAFSGPTDPLTSAIALMPESEIIEAARVSTGEVPQMLDAMMRRQVSESPKQALARAVRMTITGEYGQGGFNDEFAVRAFLTEAASRLGPRVQRLKPDLPLRVRFLCPAQLGDFDFETETFPLDSSLMRHCNLRRISASPAPFDVPIEFDLGPMPEELRIPVAEARTFRESITGKDRFGRAKDLGLNLAVDVDLHLGSRTQDGGVAVFAMKTRRAGAFELVLRSDPAKVIHRFSDQDLPEPELSEDEQVAALVKSGATDWHLRDKVERRAIAELAKMRDFGDLFWQERFEAQDGRTLTVTSTFTAESLEVAAADILGQRTARIEDLSAQLVLPKDHFAVLASARSDEEPFDMVVLVSEQPLDSYRSAISEPPEKAAYFWTELTIDLHDTVLTQMPDGQRVLLVFGNPAQASFWIPDGDQKKTMTRNAPFATAAFSRGTDGAGGSYSAQTVWDVTDLAHHVVTTMGVDPEAFVQMALKRGEFLRDDAFGRQDAGTTLARDVRPTTEGAMALGRVRLGAYDFDRKGYPLASVSLDLTQDKQFSARYTLAQSVILRLSRDGIIPMAPDVARDWQAANASHPEYPARFTLTLGEVSEKSSGARYYDVAARLSEVELLSPDADPYLRDPRAILFRSAVLPMQDDPVTAEHYAAPTPPTQEAGEPDIPNAVAADVLGVTLLQPLDDAIAQIAAEIGEYETYRMTRKGWMEEGPETAEVFPWSPYREAVLLSGQDGADNVTLFHEPETDVEGKVTALSRARFFSPGTGPGAERLSELLSDKYGPAAVELAGEKSARILLWQSTIGAEAKGILPSGCEARAARMMRGHLIRVRDEGAYRKAGQRPRMDFQPWYDEEGNLAAPPQNSPPLLSFMFRDPMECQREFVIASLQPGDDGRVEALRVLLVRPNLPHVQSKMLREKLKAAPAEDAGKEIKL